jgi:hypothetical protein
MDFNRHKTQKNPTPLENERLKTMIEASTNDAYSRAWHRIERGLRLNRIRMFINDVATQYEMSDKERGELFEFLQKLLDKKQLNTLKVVNYDQVQQKITTIKGLEMQRDDNGTLVWIFNQKKVRPDVTRKKKKGEEIQYVSIQSSDAVKEEEEQGQEEEEEQKQEEQKQEEQKQEEQKQEEQKQEEQKQEHKIEDTV